jgi:hypothetical protein
MPPRDWAFRVQDILDAIAKIQRYVSEINFEATRVRSHLQRGHFDDTPSVAVLEYRKAVIHVARWRLGVVMAKKSADALRHDKEGDHRTRSSRRTCRLGTVLDLRRTGCSWMDAWATAPEIRRCDPAPPCARRRTSPEPPTCNGTGRSFVREDVFAGRGRSDVDIRPSCRQPASPASPIATLDRHGHICPARSWTRPHETRYSTFVLLAMRANCP